MLPLTGYTVTRVSAATGPDAGLRLDLTRPLAPALRRDLVLYDGATSWRLADAAADGSGGYAWTADAPGGIPSWAGGDAACLALALQDTVPPAPVGAEVDNLDVFFHLGRGGVADANLRSRPALHGLEELVSNMLGDDDRAFRPCGHPCRTCYAAGVSIDVSSETSVPSLLWADGRVNFCYSVPVSPDLCFDANVGARLLTCLR